jgi:membrane protease YdiL (CAAX protease family)
MNKMETPAQHTSLVLRAERYWVESRRPLVSLVFIAPLLVIYEAGVLLWNVPANGADAFLQKLLEMLGFGQHLLAPGLIVVILLGWQYLSHEPWRFSSGVLPAMVVESIALGLCLRVIAFVQSSIFTLGLGENIRNATERAIGFLGAGIYEELLFRLILLTLLAWAFRRAIDRPRLAVVLAVVVSSLLFAAAHHVGPYGEPFDCAHLPRFLFRFLAGVFFSVVYVYRGFGIAAGSHAAYDIFVG